MAPVWFTVAIGSVAVLGVLVIGLWAWSARGTTTFIIVRHAEKQLERGSDPPLSAAGAARARRLAALLGDPSAAAPPAAIYVSDTRRAAETAAPLAARLGLTPIVIARGDPRETVRAIEQRHRGSTVAVVGHVDTLPRIVELASRGRVHVRMRETDFEHIYVVTRPGLGRSTLLSLRY